MDRLYLSTIRAFSTAIEAKDGVTSSHIHRVQSYTLSLARALGVVDPVELKAIEAAALLHDTGKLAVPEYILNKPGRLTAAEFEQMKLHVDVGADILSSIGFPYPVVPIVQAHHESWDGSGYPRGLCGEEIPLGARILSVVDCYDALTSDRPYRLAMTTEQALAIVRERRGQMYDPNVVDAFIALLPTLSSDTVAEPQLQRAVTRIRQAAQQDGALPAAPPATMGARSVVHSLSRVMAGAPGVEDLARIVAPEIQRLASDAGFVFYMTSDDGHLDAQACFGLAVPNAGTLTMAMGERVSGWAAATRRQVVNADARLDLGSLAASEGLQFTLATPLVQDDRCVGVLSAYSAEAFADDVARAITQVAHGLAPIMALAAPAVEQLPQPVSSSRANLRVAASR
ncbi:MAG: HD domain-containing protein [Acidobacteriota bacterium]|nr:HD domain-containing protein [Acidobacteriota bacterium]